MSFEINNFKNKIKIDIKGEIVPRVEVAQKAQVLKQEIIEGREKNCSTRTDALAKREKEAEEKEKCLAREESRLATLEAGLKETAGQKIMEAQILVEEARNEKLKEQRLREEQEARLAEIGGGEDGIPPVVLSECGIGEEIRLLKEEHGEEIMLLRKKHEE